MRQSQVMIKNILELYGWSDLPNEVNFLTEPLYQGVLILAWGWNWAESQ